MQYIKNNVITASPNIPYVSNPTHETIIAHGWEVYTTPIMPISDWLHPQFELRITAPKELAKSYPEMKVWFDINGWAIESINGCVHMYCPSIAEEDKPLIRGHKLKVEQLINNEAVEIVI